MKGKIFLCSLLMVLSGATATADTTQTVTIDGTEVGKTVSSLTFDGANVVITYADATTETVEMESLVISFAYGNSDGSTTGISNVSTADGTVGDGRVYTLGGQYVGTTAEGLQPGVYIRNNKKIVIK